MTYRQYRSFTSLSDFEKDIILKAPSEGLQELAQRMNLNPNTLRARRSELRKNIPRNISTVREQPLHLETPNAVVLGDLHCPMHHREMLARMLYVAETRHPEIRDCIIIGDVFDFNSISSHIHNGPDSSPDDDIESAGEVLRLIMKSFDRLYICNGNHDERGSKKLNAQFSLKHLIHAAVGLKAPACEVLVTNYDWITLGTDWLVGHPSSYSGMGGKTPAEIALLEQKNVVTGHNHIIGAQQSKDGRWIGIDAGAMTSPEYHWYVQRRLTKFSRWNSGFIVIKNNYPYLYWEMTTDWRALGCE